MDGPNAGTHLGQWYLSISIAVYSWKLVQLEKVHNNKLLNKVTLI